MSRREKFKQGWKQAKDDVRSLFKPKVEASDNGSTGPETPSVTQLHTDTGTPVVTGQIGNQSTSVLEIPPPVRADTSPCVIPQTGDTSDVGNLMDHSLHNDSVTQGPNLRPPKTDPQGVGMSGTVSTQQSTSQLQNSEISSTEVLSTHTELNAPQPTHWSTPEMKPQAPSGQAAGLKALTTGLWTSATNALKFGPLQDISDILQSFADSYIIEGKAKQEYELLCRRLQTMLEELESHPEEGISPTVMSEIDSMYKFVEGELLDLVNKQKGKEGGRLRMAEDEEARFLNCTSQIQMYMDQVSIKTSIRTSKLEEEQSKARIKMGNVEEEQARAQEYMHKLSADISTTKSKIEERPWRARVDKLQASSFVTYNSIVGQDLRRRECTPGTRANVLASLLSWSSDSTTGGVYWLNGMAGTGKTTIAYSVCKELAEKGRLAASFFCSHLREECRNVNEIFPSIAYQLAQFSPAFRSALSVVLEEGNDAHYRRLDEQCKKLIREPLLDVHTVKPITPGDMVVVIDALDECENKASTKAMLLELLSNVADLPIKFIVSSRPEPQIRDQMTAERVRSRLVLHELDTGEVQTDIETYLREELKPMNPPPDEALISALVKKAGTLFIYAATAVRYISYDDFQSDPMGRLDDILSRSQFQDSEENEIDQLYNMIVGAALDDRGLRPVERVRRKQVLYTVICAREPLTVEGISELLDIKRTEHVRAALRPLWSVLEVGGSKPVTTLHASFVDFMLDSARCITHYCSPEDQNRILAEHCFSCIAHIQPLFNVCRLESSHLLDEKVANMNERVEKSISPSSLYACRYWADHVEAGRCALNVTKQLQDFLSTRLLLWMEVLNMNGTIQAGAECMNLAVEWCNQFVADEELVELTRDAKRFVDTFASNPVSQSTPHIYVSMLPFWPESAPIKRYYSRFTRGPVQPEGTALGRRPLALISTWTFEGSIETMSISPDGLLVALGIGKDVLVIDSSSGRVVKGPLKGHTMSVQLVAFSPDEARILSGGIEYSTLSATIIGWDAQTGDTILGPLQLVGHTSYISCLSFSPNCTCAATSSDDLTVCVWDIKTGRVLHSLRTEYAAWRAVFSPDGTIIAAQLEKTIRVWDIQTKNPVATNQTTHTGDILQIAFIPNSTHLAYFTDNAVHVWNIQSGDMVLRSIQERTNRDTCISCSPDGRYIASGSWDRTVRVWDAQHGNLLLGPLEAHTGDITLVAFPPDSSRIISACSRGLICTWDAHQRNLTPTPPSIPAPTPTQSPSSLDRITCVKFSPDGTRFVSGSNQGTISIWDAHTGEMIVGPIKPHSRQINAVDFLGDRVVSGYDDETICVCDARSGEVVLGPLELGSERIDSVAYSPGGKLIAVGSYGSVDVWNAEDGSRVLGPFTGLEGYVLSLQFSPDGTRIVAGYRRTRSNIAIWDIPEGTTVFSTLEGHTYWVTSISYSPNGALIASGSYDKTIIIWDAYTGKIALGPLTGHSERVHSVHFSPDSSRLVSGSIDRTIRIWDIQTGETMFELLHGHEGGIKSAAYSPDGTRILSLSEDGSVRIHDARSPEERAQLRLASDVGEWSMNKDGWVVDDQLRPLVWVPGDLRRALMWSRTQVMVAPCSYVRLHIDGSRIGESWEKSYRSGM